ncbi:MAG: hypothetical protein JWM76_27 [Pseudonocardiales bacterium]|nr:hypothetical protein [Pseudonocardiales bacterium]
MARWIIQFDMRAPEWGPPIEELYATAIEMAAWADERGAAEVDMGEHHGSDDGYLPAPTVLHAAMAARTKHAKISFSAILLPLHHPARVAEEINVLDIISGGRVRLTVGLGYVESEFRMFGLDIAQRRERFDEMLPVFLKALKGEDYAFEGSQGRVTPRSLQAPRVPVRVGGSVKASALRAARFGDSFQPTSQGPELPDLYRAECERLGRPAGPVERCNFPRYVHVTEDPEKTWQEIGRNVLHEHNSYGRWSAAAGGVDTGFAHGQQLTDVSGLRDSPLYAVVTPSECVELWRSLDEYDLLRIKPLMGGIAPEVAWRSLELFASEVLPHVDVEPAREIPILEPASLAG